MSKVEKKIEMVSKMQSIKPEDVKHGFRVGIVKDDGSIFLSKSMFKSLGNALEAMYKLDQFAIITDSIGTPVAC